LTRNVHDEAHALIALGGDLSDAQQGWLRAHLGQCGACCQYAQAVTDVVGALRSMPISADSRLVRASQMRVRFHARRLQEIRQRILLVGIACLGVGLSATLTAPALWRLFAWIGQMAEVPNVVWEVSFMFFFALPGVVVAVLLLARGAHLLQGGNDSSPGG
jgi:hypothetical protein